MNRVNVRKLLTVLSQYNEDFYLFYFFHYAAESRIAVWSDSFGSTSNTIKYCIKIVLNGGYKYKIWY